MSKVTFATELNEFFAQNGKALIGLDKPTRKALIKATSTLADAPAWVERPSDIPTYYCSKQATGFKVPEQEKFRATRGHVSLVFNGKYWNTKVTLGTELLDTEEGNAILLDMMDLEANGVTYYNVSTMSSERRHCEALAKAVALYYKLAFSPISDVPNIDMKDLQTKERRVEIYKYASKMVNETPVEVVAKATTEKAPVEIPATEGKTKKKKK